MASHKNDYNMEAGLLSTDREERIMSDKEALLQDSEPTQPQRRRISPARKVLVGFAVCCLLGVGLGVVGHATNMSMCPGHLRHGHGDAMDKHGMNSHRPNLSESIALMVKRQNTPGPSDTNQATEPTQGTSEQPSATGPSEQPTKPTQEPTQESTQEPTQESTQEPTQGPTQESTEEPTQEPTSQPSATREPTSAPSNTQTNNPTSAQDTASEEPSASETQEPTESEAETTAAPTRKSTTEEPKSTEEPESTEDSEPTATDDDQETSATERPTTTRSTITGTGTRRTSSAVPQTFTSTLEDGGVTTMTSTSWVEVVPSAEATASGSPDLQNAAPRSSASVGGVISAVVGMLFGGLMLL